MYIIQSIFNNNVALVKDDEGSEFVLMGKGIGFNTSSGKQVNENKIEKKFLLDLFFKNEDNNYFDIIRDIIETFEQELNLKLNDHIYYALSDHIDYAIERASTGVVFRSPIQWEISKAYPKEYAIAKKAVEVLNENLKSNLPPEEATFITLHIINATNEVSDYDLLFEELTLIDDILRLIRSHFKVDLDTNSVNYERFLTHLKFMIHRVRKDEQLNVVNASFYTKAIEEYPDIFECVVKITKLIKNQKDITLNNEESFYLMLHISRVLSR